VIRAAPIFAVPPTAPTPDPHRVDTLPDAQEDMP
jgi:hypothetical protein